MRSLITVLRIFIFFTVLSTMPLKAQVTINREKPSLPIARNMAGLNLMRVTDGSIDVMTPFRFQFLWHKEWYGKTSITGEERLLKVLGAMIPLYYDYGTSTGLPLKSTSDIHFIVSIHYKDSLYHPPSIISKDLITLFEPENLSTTSDATINFGPPTFVNNLDPKLNKLIQFNQFLQIDLLSKSLRYVTNQASPCDRLTYSFFIQQNIPYISDSRKPKSLENENYFQLTTFLSGFDIDCDNTIKHIDLSKEFFLIAKDHGQPYGQTAPLMACGQNPNGVSIRVKNETNVKLTNVRVYKLATPDNKNAPGYGNINPGSRSCYHSFRNDEELIWCGPPVSFETSLGDLIISYPIDCEGSNLKNGAFTLTIKEIKYHSNGTPFPITQLRNDITGQIIR